MGRVGSRLAVVDKKTRWVNVGTTAAALRASLLPGCGLAGVSEDLDQPIGPTVPAG
jgi:hypothetical protein